jgi:hypothetical protein
VLVNNSSQAVPYKPESGPKQTTVQLCQPGARCEMDGTYPWLCNANPTKYVNGCTVTYTDGTAKPQVDCPLFNFGSGTPWTQISPWAGQLFIGGQVSNSFLKKHTDWPKPNFLPGCGAR